MAKTPDTIHVKIQADTSELQAALTAKLEQNRRMRRFNTETRRIRRLYAVADRVGRPVWECGPMVAQLECFPQLYVSGFGL